METVDVNNDEDEAVDLNSCFNEISKNSDSSNKSKSEYRSRTCTFFYNYGYCKFGNSCRYKHLKKGTLNDKYRSRNGKSSLQQNVYTHMHVDKKDILQNSVGQTSLKQNCRYFDMGGCKKGENCEFIHSVNRISDDLSSLNVSLQTVPKKPFSHSSKSAKKRIPLCYYFKKGQCYKGDNCKYYHQNKINFKNCEKVTSLESSSAIDAANTSLSSKTNVISGNSATKNTIAVVNRPLNVYNLSSLTTDDAVLLRCTEINQFKKRFPHFEAVVENQTFSILFEPSDPDWAFDVNKLKLKVDFPANYPTEKCKITVLESAEYLLPHLFIKYLNKAICDWIDTKYEENTTSNKTELIFRPFLKWFDKNLEDLFIIGLRKVKQDLKAKEDGIEFVPVENLFSSPLENCAEDEISTSEKSGEGKCFEEDTSPANSSQLPEQKFVFNNKVSSAQNQQNNVSYYSSNDGMKIIFTDLEFVEGTAAFICTKISATLQCSRCKTPFNMKSVPKKSNSQICSKCSKNVGFMFEPSTVHQFSSVLGILHLLDCVAVDVNLVECHFLVDCFKCSKQVPVDGIHYGQRHKMWCPFCSEKMMMSIGSVKFQTVRLTSAPAVKYPSAKKTEKKVKDPVVKEGEPLPNLGACKHYKKSFRWLRFPCCGRLYPCDECHNEKETDHEMKYASRMLCGFCAKEQPYSREKPCILCSQSMTKKSGSHWEGGKGCRNKIQMSREDKQKYSGVSKTVSRKAQMNKPKKKH